LQELLLKGDRVAAIRHAMNENLWSHALIIASCVNKDLWKEVVTEFVKHEMGTQKGDTFESNGRESLRVLYSLFAGQGRDAGMLTITLYLGKTFPL
jgi:COPII coat assembly protein SEC16